MTKRLIFFGVWALGLSGCSVLQRTSKKDLTDGFYQERSSSLKRNVYIDNTGETICVYPAKMVDRNWVVDTSESCRLYDQEIRSKLRQTISFNKPSFDIDFLTIPLKFRPGQKGVPVQLNTNLNGAVYIGYRTDKYVLKYIPDPLGKASRTINHFGFSVGAFTGIGNTFISPTNTNSLLQDEYDGIVWSKGVAGIFAVNSFTVGLSLGFDHLLDKNHGIWIYQSKPWLGLAFGLNLN